MTSEQIILSGGGGKSGGSTRAAQEDPNTLRSNTIVKIINLVSYGPCYGLSDQTNPGKCIYFAGTQYQNNDGTYNFTGVSHEERDGSPSQSYIPGYVSAANSYSIGQEVKKSSPVIRTVSGPIDACRVIVGIPYLASQNTTNGDLLKTTVNFKLSKRVYGTTTWTDVFNVTYYDKCVSEYNEAFYIPLGGTTDWDIKFERITEDSTATSLLNKTNWSAISLLTENKFYYPNCALVAMRLDASQFGSQQQVVSFKYKGVICRVPTNYDPVARTYSGIWNGTFKLAWTNNPAWLLYYILTEPNVGLGDIIDPSTIDKYALYSIGTYCDELVPNGYGGYEPRYTFNYQFTSSADAFAVVQLIAASFRGLVYEANGTIRFRADMPEDPIRVYTDDDVIGGFQYEGTALSARHSRVIVQWFDQDNPSQAAYEIVDDPEAFELYGLNETSIVAYGCTSRGRARRFGLWLLDTEKSYNTVNFEAAWDSARLEPGNIIGIADKDKAGFEDAAIVLSSTSTSLELDREITITYGQNATAWINCADGSFVKRKLTNSPGVTTSFSFDEPLSSEPVMYGRVGVSFDNAQIIQYRVVGIVEKDEGRFLITAIFHDPDKYLRVENGVHLAPQVYSAYNKNKPSSPVKISFQEYLYRYNTTIKSAITISWIPGLNLLPPRGYEVQIQKADGEWRTSGQISEITYDFKDVDSGEHSLRVRAISLAGVPSDWYVVNVALFGERTAPSQVEDFSVNVLGDVTMLSWKSNSAIDFDHYIVKFSPLVSGALWQTSNILLDNQTSTTAQVPTRTGTYLVKAVNIAGNESDVPAVIISTIPGSTALNAVAAISDYPSWDGVGANVYVDGTVLKLQTGKTSGIYYLSMSGASGTISSSAIDILSSDDILGLSDIYGEIGSIDLGASYRCQISSFIDAYGEAVGVHWEDLGFWKDLGTWGSGDPSVWRIRAEVQTTEDDPASPSAVWTTWETLVVGYRNARAFRFRLIFETDNALVIPVLNDASFTIDMPDRIVTDKAIVSSTSGTSISFSPPFRDISAVGVTARDMATGDYFEYTSNPTKDGFTIKFKNLSGVAISRTFDYIATGYGEESV